MSSDAIHNQELWLFVVILGISVAQKNIIFYVEGGLSIRSKKHRTLLQNHLSHHVLCKARFCF